LLRLVAAVLGLVALTAGVVTLFTTDKSAGGLFLIALGTALVLAALLWNRIQLESFEFMGAKIKVREVVRGRLRLAESAGAAGEGRTLSGVREQAATLHRLAGLYDLYGYIRRTQPASDERTSTLDQLARRMREVGREAEFEPAEVAEWFHEGDDALRVIALNLMLARPQDADFMAVLETMDEPRSLFEQYYGVRLAEAMLPTLGRIERKLLGAALERARQRESFLRDRPLMAASDRILAELSR
jgi:hypothetical protein